MDTGCFSIVNLGCRVNRAEMDLVASELERSGCRRSGEREADVVVVNTCAVTAEAEAKTRKAIRHAAGLPQKPIVIATGCVANLFSGELEALADNVLVIRDKSAIPTLVAHKLQRGFSAEGPEVPVGMTPTGRTRPGVKIQDGCDRRCSFCIVWKARGRSRSVDPEVILRQVKTYVAGGLSEVVLTGINLGAYSWDDGAGRLDLAGLLTLLLDKTDVGRLRLSSIEPPEVTKPLLYVLAASKGRIAPFLHICLQSGCDATLSRMARVYTAEDYRTVVSQARELVPDLALGCDLIVGFPGETAEEFEESLAFCREMRFAKMHIFRYSKRPGTPAAMMKDQVDPHVAAARSSRMHKLAARMRADEAACLVGTRQMVLVQEDGLGVTGGLFDIRLDRELRPGTLTHCMVDHAGTEGLLQGTVRDIEEVQ